MTKEEKIKELKEIYKDDEFLLRSELISLEHNNGWINNGRYEYICQVTRCSEKAASEIIDLFQLQYHKYKRIYQLHNLENINQKLNHTFSAIESIHSLLESQGIEITNNTYIFKV